MKEDDQAQRLAMSARLHSWCNTEASRGATKDQIIDVLVSFGMVAAVRVHDTDFARAMLENLALSLDHVDAFAAQEQAAVRH